MPSSNILENQLKRMVRALIRNNISNDDFDALVIDEMLRFHYGTLSQKEMLVCECIIEIAFGGEGASYIEVFNRLGKDAFQTADDITCVVRGLISKGVIDWMATLRFVNSDQVKLSSIHKWECLTLRPKWIQNQIFAAIEYARVISYEIQNIDKLDSNYYQDGAWLFILHPPKKFDTTEV